jgi:hypothetical protein
MASTGAGRTGLQRGRTFLLLGLFRLLTARKVYVSQKFAKSNLENTPMNIANNIYDPAFSKPLKTTTNKNRKTLGLGCAGSQVNLPGDGSTE